MASLAMGLHAQQPAVPKSKPAVHVSGVIRVCGSPQMGDLLKLYEAGFALVQPDVRFENDLRSTVSAVSGVADGSADIGLLGREIWPEEETKFTAARGHVPLVIDIATGSYDVPKATYALMVFAPVANPIKTLSLDELRRIFGAGDRAVHTWGDLGLRGEWAARPIHLYGFARDNDKARIFAQLVFDRDTNWSTAVTQFSNVGDSDAGQQIVRAVANDADAIGISNVHYATPTVRAVPISRRQDGVPVPPTRENVASRRYPLTRSVYMVTDPQRSPGPAVREFLRYVLGPQGQHAVAREGSYLPLPATIVQRELNALSSSDR